MLKKLLIGFVGLVVVLVIVSQFLPAHVHVERQTTVNAAPEAVFPLLNNPKNTEKWSPWLERDRNTALTYSGPAEGVGAKLSWRSENREVGVGNLEITESKPSSFVRVALAFEGHGEATSTYNLKAVPGGTELVWGFDTDLGWNPILRYMGLMFETWIGADYERGLANLKRVAEGA